MLAKSKDASEKTGMLVTTPTLANVLSLARSERVRSRNVGDNTNIGENPKNKKIKFQKN